MHYGHYSSSAYYDSICTMVTDHCRETILYSAHYAKPGSMCTITILIHHTVHIVLNVHCSFYSNKCSHVQCILCHIWHHMHSGRLSVVIMVHIKPNLTYGSKMGAGAPCAIIGTCLDISSVPFCLLSIPATSV